MEAKARVKTEAAAIGGAGVARFLAMPCGSWPGLLGGGENLLGSAGAGEYAGANRYALVAGDFEAQVKEGQNATHARADAAERDNLRRLHRASILSVDRAIGKVLDALEADGLAASTIVVVLADHGENLLEDGGALAHGESVERDRSARIPWIVRWPGKVPVAAIDGNV